ncbi:RidA family protein [Streptococcus pseudoporcinus]|uniref:Endoribonuclease L-PSP n=1 Tax=Streptococcus pseudoporcinus LQ 940-04 TaxID=875093 RepID=G5K9Y3_9STRE|nr:Rid family detoxifying hydrolase [Streptococcus pseudoporcinus]EFR43520.1 putative endoribonuclease L-PSP [Streptococcus pseudoporcinus SPIN 20026]EHI65528.1 putative endoribonuclease L-PSP [Streptococcus pseudoporcinus LQ 940-04]VEF93728.1 endoribonuclease L-PSP [Streptococcus pseudoporcinus]
MKNYPDSIGPYSIYTVEGNTLYTSGQLPVIPETGDLASGFEAQCRQSFANIKGILEEQDLDLSHVFKLTIYLSDLKNFNTLNEVMEDLFEEPYPIRTAYQVAALPKGALIEVEALARLTKS